MTSADQTGQFHTGSTDRPAAEPSIFQAMADSPAAGVQAEESVTQSLADAANPEKRPEGEPEAEQTDASLEEWTVPELKALLDDAGVDYPSSAHKADLIKLAEDVVETEGAASEEADEDALVAREKAQQTDSDRVERLKLDQLSTEPPDEKAAEAITKENEELQLAAHAAHLDALEVAEKKDAETEKAKEAEAEKAEAEAKKASQSQSQPPKTTQK